MKLSIKNQRTFFYILVVTIIAGCLSFVLSACSTSTETDESSQSSSADYTTNSAQTSNASEVAIHLSENTITVDDKAATTDVDNAVYLSNDIVYYEDRDTYDSGNVYGEGGEGDKHTASEAAENTVVNITQAGTYRISGTLPTGQIAINLGEDAKTNPEAVVTLILDNADITCTVAPAIIFYNVYECDTAWVAYTQDESLGYTANHVQDTTAAGANIVLADNSTNTITGSHVAKIYRDDEEEKKLHKYDGTCYSKMSMNVDGEDSNNGVLNIIADNEGLDTELHLTINGGKINIESQDDGVNTNEDGVSVTTINDGSLHIVAGLGNEGDGVDSNGFLTINGGVVISTANPASDSGLDSDMGSYVNGGYVVATGSTMDWADSDSDQVTINLQFASAQDADEAIIVTREDGTVIFAYDPDQDETTGSHNRGYLGAVVSCPSFAVGDTYYVYVGGNVDGTDVDGLYDADTVTGFSGAVRQVYTGTDVGGMGGFGGMGGPGGMGNFEDLDLGDLNLDDLNLDSIDDIDNIDDIDELRTILKALLSVMGGMRGMEERPNGDYENPDDAENGQDEDSADGSTEDNADQSNARPSAPDRSGDESDNTDDANRPDMLMPNRGEQSGETTNVRFDMGENAEGNEEGENAENADNADSEATDDNAQATENQRPAYAFYMTDMVNSFSGVQDETESTAEN